MKKYTVYLISPDVRYHHYGVQKEFAAIMGKRIFNFSVALPLLAAFFPRHYDIKIIDASYQALPAKAPDLVGLTCFTSNRDSCYAIADRYRNLGSKVMIGGAHATFSVDEALRHADTVIQGECEMVMEELIRDFEAGQLKSSYRAKRLCDFKTSPIPRWDLVDKRNLNIVGIQATRGCPFNCEFCLVEKLFGQEHRRREVSDIVREIKALPIRRLFFVDDNLTLNKGFARELFAALKPLKLSWSCQASIEIGQDPELLREMAEAGCMSLLIGFETLDQATLQDTHKLQNQCADYGRMIANIHQAGILVIGSFIVGFEADRLEMFDQILDFSIRHRLIFANVYCLLPTHGTELEARIISEQRTIEIEAEFLNANFPSHRYRNFGLVAMYDKYVDTITRLLSFELSSAKVLALLGSGDFLRHGPGGATGMEKIRGMVKVLTFYVFSGIPERRAVFRQAWALGGKTASVDNVVYLLLVLCGFHDYLAQYQAVYPVARTKLAEAEAW